MLVLLLLLLLVLLVLLRILLLDKLIAEEKNVLLVLPVEGVYVDESETFDGDHLLVGILQLSRDLS